MKQDKNQNIGQRNLEQNIFTDYIFCFFRNFDIASAVWVLYMIYRGLPLWQVGIVEGIFHITSFLCEIPSGALADLFGRKKMIVCGRILYAVSAVIQLFSTNVYMFAGAFIISAVSYNLNSGSEEALLYDSMKQLGKEEDYVGVNGKLNMVIEVSQSAATFLGGVLAEYSYDICYLTVLVVAVLSLIPAFLFVEPEMAEKKPDNKKNDKVSFRMHFEICAEILKDDKEVLKILIYYPIVLIFHAVVYFYGQEFFSEDGWNKIEISLIMLAMGGFSCLGAWSSERILEYFGDKTKYFASLGMAVSILVMSMDQFALSVLGFAGANFTCAMLYPIQSLELNARIPSGQRATLISVDSMFFSVFMVLFFPVCGIAAEKIGLHAAFGGLGVIQLVLMCGLMLRKRTEK